MVIPKFISIKKNAQWAYSSCFDFLFVILAWKTKINPTLWWLYRSSAMHFSLFKLMLKPWQGIASYWVWYFTFCSENRKACLKKSGDIKWEILSLNGSQLHLTCSINHKWWVKALGKCQDVKVVFQPFCINLPNPKLELVNF